MAPEALFWTHHAEAPSVRHRLLPVMEGLIERGWTVRIEQLPRGRYYRRILERRAELEAASLLVIGKITLALGEADLVRRFARRIIFDFDDAIYLRRSVTSDRRWLDLDSIRRAKFSGTCAVADQVVAGNPTLASAAAEDAARIWVLPTSVSLPSAEHLAGFRRHPKTLVWIGCPENLVYLERSRPVFAQLCRDRGAVLRIICSRFPDWPEVRMEKVFWSPAEELPSLATAGIGLMPLFDDPWARGKCGFKLLQYMSVALPTVASPVGLNQEIVSHGSTGYLATDPRDWSAALGRLLDYPEYAAAMGASGRRRVARRYERTRYVERYLEMVERVLAMPRLPKTWRRKGFAHGSKPKSWGWSSPRAAL